VAAAMAGDAAAAAGGTTLGQAEGAKRDPGGSGGAEPLGGSDPGNGHSPENARQIWGTR
jgi:hypothetical protein